MPTIKCIYCESTRVVKTIKVNGRVVGLCDGCYRSFHRKCTRCNCSISSWSGPITADMAAVLPSIKTVITSRMRGDGSTSIGNYCPSCYDHILDNNIIKVCSCGRAYHHTVSATGTCPICNRRMLSGIQSYSFRPEPLFHTVRGVKKKPPAGLVEGIEVELEVPRSEEPSSIADAVRVAAPETFLYAKGDGSIEHGFELVSHPATLKFHQKVWKNVCKAMKANGCREGSSCGIHIHVNKSFFPDESHRLLLGLFFALNEKEIVKIARRSASRWAKFKKIKPLDLTAVLKDTERYEAINWGNSATIEFRIFATAIDDKIICADLEFVHAVCHFVRTTATEDMLIAKGHGWFEFCQYIDGKVKLYPVLKEFMTTTKCWTDKPLTHLLIPDMTEIFNEYNKFVRASNEYNQSAIKVVESWCA